MKEETRYMIGDWVYIFDPEEPEDKKAYQISEIRENGIRTHMFNDTYEPDWFEPIPLTEDILKANALSHDDCEWWYDSTNKRFMLKVYGYTNVFEGTLDFVHELQHALRLCGLNYLANNFKLTSNE